MAAQNSLHHHGLPGNLCSRVWNMYCHFFFTGLAVCRTLDFTVLLSSLSLLFFCATGFFLLHLQYISPEVPLLSPVGSTLPSCRSTLELAAIGSSGYGGSFLQPLTEDTPVTSPHYENQYTSTVPCFLFVLCTAMGYFMCYNPLRSVLALAWVIHDSGPLRRICPHGMELHPGLCLQL